QGSRHQQKADDKKRQRFECEKHMITSFQGVIRKRSVQKDVPQEPSWTLATEVLRREYTRHGMLRRSSKDQPGLHGYALFSNMEPDYIEHIATTVVSQHSTFIDNEVLHYLLHKLRGRQLTPRQEECASLVAQGLSNDEIALRMGFLNAQGQPNMRPLENLVSELYTFFTIEGAPSDPGRRVLLAHAYEAYAGLRPI
ncbi:MAG TPA: hypothetical protein VGM01_13970, partial [Ktedonobacteraceae bacterium]